MIDEGMDQLYSILNQYENVCLECGAKFNPSKYNDRKQFCSYKCGQLNWRKENKDKVRKDNKIRRKKWKQENPEKYSVKMQRDKINSKKYKARKYRYNQRRQLEKLYGITLEQFLGLKISQNNKCAICNEEKKLHVDHDHKTGRVRELLCTNCNIMIGQAKEDVNKLYKAIEYLEKWNR